VLNEKLGELSNFRIKYGKMIGLLKKA